MSAVALLITSIALTAGSTALNFVNAGKQRRAASDAEFDAEQALIKAREKLGTNFYENLSINKEKYVLEREALLSAGAQATAAGAESERGAAAVAGRVLAAQQKAQQQQTSRMGDEQKKLEGLVAQEDSRLRDIGVQLDLEEVKGAQIAAGRAEQSANMLQAQGMQGILDTAKAGVSLSGGLKEAKAAGGGDVPFMLDSSNLSESGFTGPTALNDAFTSFQATEQGALFKDLDFSQVNDIINRPSINDAGQPQVGGMIAGQDFIQTSLGDAGVKDFNKFLRQQKRALRQLNNTGLVGEKLDEPIPDDYQGNYDFIPMS
tara:strand:+ start:3051 stop:4004 length:954 start_codon:yes stop_codon:yes gene_type:complete